MSVYLDASVVLGRFLGQRPALRQWGGWDRVFTSVLTRIEFLRTVDRLRLEGRIQDDERVALQGRLEALLRATHSIPITVDILNRAAQAFPTVLGTLDALHVASALAVTATLGERPNFLTHDEQQARAARALGFMVEGI